MQKMRTALERDTNELVTTKDARGEETQR